MFPLEEARQKFPHIESWEAGEAFPTYPQLEALAGAFKVPIAVFFFPEPPEVPPVRESFRTLPDVQFARIPRRIHFLLRRANALQMNLVELNNGQNPAERHILRNLAFDPDIDVQEMARIVRDYLGVPIEEQIAWENEDAALEAWRAVFESVGIAVFKDAFREGSYSGFCLYDSVFPLIYINNSGAKTRQIFTLFHELAHLLFNTSGVDTAYDEQIDDLPPDDRRIEILCNRFAAEFLLPSSVFEIAIRGKEPSEETATAIANRYKVSRESVFRKFLDRYLITEEIYRDAAQRWSHQRQSTSGGNHYWTKIAYLGINYVNLAFSRYHQNHITEPQLADYLDVKVKNLPKLESYVQRKMM